MVRYSEKLVINPPLISRCQYMLITEKNSHRFPRFTDNIYMKNYKLFQLYKRWKHCKNFILPLVSLQCTVEKIKYFPNAYV